MINTIAFADSSTLGSVEQKAYQSVNEADKRRLQLLARDDAASFLSFRMHSGVCQLHPIELHSGVCQVVVNVFDELVITYVRICIHICLTPT